MRYSGVRFERPPDEEEPALGQAHAFDPGAARRRRIGLASQMRRPRGARRIDGVSWPRAWLAGKRAHERDPTAANARLYFRVARRAGGCHLALAAACKVVAVDVAAGRGVRDALLCIEKRGSSGAASVDGDGRAVGAGAYRDVEGLRAGRDRERCWYAVRERHKPKALGRRVVGAPHDGVPMCRGNKRSLLLGDLLISVCGRGASRRESGDQARQEGRPHRKRLRPLPAMAAATVPGRSAGTRRGRSAASAGGSAR
jgi:hypothetical protein